MTELEELRRDNDRLRRERDSLVQDAADAKQALDAIVRGEVDAVAIEGAPILLHAAQEQLRRNEGLLRAIIEKTSDIVSLTARDGTTRYLTPGVWQRLGWTDKEMAGQLLRDHTVPEDRGRIESEISRLIRTGERDMAIEIRVHHRDGSLRWFESRATNLLDDPDVGAIVGTHRDITARMLAGAELHESRNELEEAQAIAHLGSWSAGAAPDAEITCSKECYRIFGVPIGKPLTKAFFFASVHPSDRERVARALPHAIATGEPQEAEFRLRLPDGELRWVVARMIPDLSTPGPPTRVFGTVLDVTERHVAIEALRASEERYRRIVENTSEGVWMFDANNLTTFVNGRMAEMLGCSVADAIGQPILNFIDETRRADADAQTENRQRTISERSDFWLRRGDGSELWCSIQVNPLFDEKGHFEGILALLRDVSAERRADEARGRLAAIVESTDDAILGANTDGTITTWNGAAETLYQYPADELVGRSLFLLVPPSDDVMERSVLARISAGERVPTYTANGRRKDGSLVEVAVTATAIRDDTDAVIGVAKISRDLTARHRVEAELQRAEDQLRQAQKMEAVGRLAGGIAHDFNNLLSVILSYAAFGIEDLKPGDPLRDDMIQIDQAGKQAASLTRQLLAFSRQQVLQSVVVDLNTILLPMDRMLRRVLGEDVALALHAATTLGRVLADPGQIEQVVMNLAVNARDAMPDGGNLTIETMDVRVGSGGVADQSGVVPGDYVLISVSDSGIGMDAATCTRIFEPFFTTKPVGKGTGLGLSTVFGIVHQSGGYVGVTSELGQGTTFKIYLPRTDRVAAAAANESAAPIRRGSETILLVEDEDQVRAVASTILRRNGYQVLETSNGGEAFLVSKDFPATIDLLLTDVVMPRMSGRKLAEELAVQRPQMKVLYASGYTDDAIVHLGVLNADVAFVQKPFTPEMLLRRVRDALNAVRPPVA
jgi:PAS domain S-box-containing protein